MARVLSKDKDIFTEISTSKRTSISSRKKNKETTSNRKMWISSTDRPRLIRLISPTNASVHDLILVDSPKFHIILDFAVNVEAYHLTIRGGNLGSYDGIDAIGTNYHIHDNEV
jgi:ribosomal protein S4E